MLVSAFFLIATLIVYIIQPTMRSNYNLALMCYLASLAATFIGLATIRLAFTKIDQDSYNSIPWLCVFIGKQTLAQS